MTLSKEAKQTLKFLEAYLADESNKGYGSLYDYGVEEGERAGRKAGRKAGMKAGIETEKYETAKRMLADGMNLEKTSEYTGLSIKILEKLRK